MLVSHTRPASWISVIHKLKSGYSEAIHFRDQYQMNAVTSNANSDELAQIFNNIVHAEKLKSSTESIRANPVIALSAAAHDLVNGRMRSSGAQVPSALKASEVFTDLSFSPRKDFYLFSAMVDSHSTLMLEEGSLSLDFTSSFISSPTGHVSYGYVEGDLAKRDGFEAAITLQTTRWLNRSVAAYMPKPITPILVDEVKVSFDETNRKYVTRLMNYDSEFSVSEISTPFITRIINSTLTNQSLGSLISQQAIDDLNHGELLVRNDISNGIDLIVATMHEQLSLIHI